jgi:hypothetical protein
MRRIKATLQIAFYTFVFALLLSRAVSAGISHDENQFIAPGQLLADHGLLPYVNYSYTHMPYGIAFYAITALISDYDFLAGRILTSVVWLICILLMIAIARTIRAGLASGLADGPTVAELLWEFAIAFVLLNHPIASYVLAAALNHSLATLFSLLAVLFFIRGVRPNSSRKSAFASGACVCAAAFIRFNYASLIVVLLALWLIDALAFGAAQRRKVLVPVLAGLLVASLPALVLVALAPAEFYYGNLVYIRLNTVYYQGLLFGFNMDLTSKIHGFWGSFLQRPIDWVLYAMLIYTAVASLIRFAHKKSLTDLGMLALAGFSAALWLTALAPTPSLAHYFFAPLPFMLIILTVFGFDAYSKSRPAAIACFLGLILALVTTVKIPNPIDQLAGLSDPSKWPPVQVHDFAAGLRDYVPRGRILSLLPMIPLEAGYDVYPFAATGPFSWRTSPLLTVARRAQYRVISPMELPSLLNQFPPDGILTGFEAANAGFGRQDLGGLEMPFVDYATQHGYKPVPLTAGFYGHPIVLWVRQP